MVGRDYGKSGDMQSLENKIKSYLELNNLSIKQEEINDTLVSFKLLNDKGNCVCFKAVNKKKACYSTNAKDLILIHHMRCV